MKKKALAIFAFILICYTANAQNLEWAKASGSSTELVAQSYSITTDVNGNVYSTGYYTGTVDFDPGPGVATLSCANEHIFIQKLDKKGALVWVKDVGGAIYSIARSIAWDNAGHILFTGTFSSTIDVDPGPGITTFTSVGTYDILIEELDTNGNFVWAKQIGSGNNDEGEDIKVDATGNIYVVGHFYGLTDFDPGTAVYTLNAGGPNIFAPFLLKLDPLGNFIWAKNLGENTSGSTFDGGLALSVAITSTGDVYASGNFNGTLDFDPGTGTRSLSVVTGGTYNAFVSKLDASGNLLWAQAIGGTGNCGATSIGVDNVGDVYISGSFDKTMDMDPGTGVFNITCLSTIGRPNTYVERLDASGNFLWGKLLGSTGNLVMHKMCTDGSGNVYTTGFLQGSGDFDPGSGTFTLSSGSSPAISCFRQKLDNNGNFVWAHLLSGGDAVEGDGISVDGRGNLYITGLFRKTYDFDPGAGIFNITAAGPGDFYVQKLSQFKFGADTKSGCAPYALGKYAYTVSGTYADTLSTTSGDSIVSVALTIITVDAGKITGASAICKSATTMLSDAVTGGTWNVLNTHASVTGGVVKGLTTGVDTVLYIVTNSCGADTAFFPITVGSCLAVSSISTDNPGMRIMPNPNAGDFRLYYAAEINTPVHVVITDVLGKKIKELTFETNKETRVDLDVVTGIYFVKVECNQGDFSDKIIIRK